MTGEKGASGARFVNNAAADPTLAHPLAPEAPGWYQLAAVVAGDSAGGGLPTLGFRLDDDPRPKTATRLAQPGWHRVLVGRPVWIDAGEHTVLLRFENDFFAGRGRDRNLRIDRYELLRLPDLPRIPVDAEPRHGGDDVRVALDPALHGGFVGGEFPVHGRAVIRGEPDSTPIVTLLVNGEAHGTVVSASPRFRLAPGALRPGANSLALQASSPRGITRTSPPITVTRVANAADAPAPRRLRYYVADPAWGDGRGLTRDTHAGSDLVRRLNSNAHVDLRLPDDLSGRFSVMIDAKGEAFDGAPIARATLMAAGSEAVVGEGEVPGRFLPKRVGAVDLVAGPKILRVAFTNDHFIAGKGDRNLIVRGVLLTEELPGQDTAAPAVSVVYPQAGQVAYRADAVVARLGDERRLEYAELLLDGEPTGVRAWLRESGRGQVLFPLTLRGLPTGEHTVSVLAVDRAGNRAVSEAVAIRVVTDGLDALTRYERAVRALRRFGYGIDDDSLAEALAMGAEAYLEQHLRGGPDDPAERALWAYVEAVYPDRYNGGQVVHRAIGHATRTPNPARARFTLLMDNHFTTWQRKARPQRKAAEYRGLADLGFAPFQSMLDHSATSPAMLFYLDQVNSFGKRLNENYAREIMELHTVGVDAGYTQQDVTELAHLITGWRAISTARLDGSGGDLANVFRFDPALNDPAARTVFGMRFAEADPEARFDRAKLAVEMLASHPQTARFVSTKIAEHYTTVPADPELIDALALAFHETGGDTGAMMRTLARWPGLWGREATPRMTHPLGHGLRLSRATGRPQDGRLAGYLRRAGFGLFDRDTPDGYPEEDPAYADSNAMLQRWRLANDMRFDLGALVPGNLHHPPKDKSGHAAWRQRVVDLIALQITGFPLGEQSNAAVLRVFAASSATGLDRIRMIAALIAQMPEANLH